VVTLFWCPAMARAKKKPWIYDKPCVGPARTFTVLEGSISCSVDIDSVKKASLDSVSCGFVSCGCSDAHQCHNQPPTPTKIIKKTCHPCIGPARTFTVLEGSISCSVDIDSVKKASLDSVSFSLVSCGCSDSHLVTTNRFQQKSSRKRTTRALVL